MDGLKAERVARVRVPRGAALLEKRSLSSVQLASAKLGSDLPRICIDPPFALKNKIPIWCGL